MDLQWDTSDDNSSIGNNASPTSCFKAIGKLVNMSSCPRERWQLGGPTASQNPGDPSRQSPRELLSGDLGAEISNKKFNNQSSFQLRRTNDDLCPILSVCKPGQMQAVPCPCSSPRDGPVAGWRMASSCHHSHHVCPLKTRLQDRLERRNLK